MKFLYKLLATYEYSSVKDLFLSMFPSWKYDLQSLSLILSAISGVLSYLFGFSPALGFAMLIAVAVEINTGIKASQKQGNSFESFRFSRCVLKLTLWAIIFYIIHSFENEYENRTHVFDIIAYTFFKILFVAAITLFLVEHITSILENKAVIDEKPKTYLIEFIQDMWKVLLSTLKGIFTTKNKINE